MSGFAYGVAAVAVPGLIGLYVAKNGHSRVVTDVFVLAIVCALGAGVAALELVCLCIWPFRLCRRLAGFEAERLDPAAASEQAAGRRHTEKRRIVVFDGICVLCNRFGRFVVGRLPDPNEVSFVPFQDAKSNPHVSMRLLQQEFGFELAELQDRIAVVDGDKIYWGPDGVIRVLGWCFFPYNPVARLGLLVPWPIRDAAYLTVANNRYRWFGTQALDKNFAKYLCPYLYVKAAFPGKSPSPSPSGGAQAQAQAQTKQD